MKKPKTTKQGSGDLLRFVRNPYLIAFVVFAVYIGFFDHYSILKQRELRAELHRLQVERQQYAETIEQSAALKQTVAADEERFARERYHMKRQDEDVFIVELR